MLSRTSVIELTNSLLHEAGVDFRYPKRPAYADESLESGEQVPNSDICCYRRGNLLRPLFLPPRPPSRIISIVTPYHWDPINSDPLKVYCSKEIVNTITPQRCNVDIALNFPSPQAPLSKPMKHLQAGPTGSSLLKVTLEAHEDASGAGYECHGTNGVGDTSISLRYERTDLQPSGALQFWLSSLAEITESVQTSGIPVHLSISSNFPAHPDFRDTLISTLKSVDDLLPSVHKASFAGSAVGQFLSYASSPSFPNLSELEVRPAGWATPWKETLECVSARSELATVEGRRFKALRSISLPQGPIDEETYERLSTLVKTIYRN